jgi:hypothetical protein
MTGPEPAPPEEPDRRPVDPDYQQSLDAGLTESFEDFCQRISKEGP